MLDPFAGTGTSMVAAANLGRHGIGIEIDPEYARFAANRIGQVGDLFSSPNLALSGFES